MVNCCFVSIVSYLWVVSYFCCLFSYHNLLELHYGDRMHKSHTAREWAIEVGLSFREVEWSLDNELFLIKYLRWEIGAPHWSVILHEMFLHVAEWGQKEVERFICWGHWGSLQRPDPEADQSTMKLVGYWISHEEIRDLYHSVYMLRRSTGPPPCGHTTEKGSNPWHPLLSKELSALMGLPHCSQRRHMRACQWTLV